MTPPDISSWLAFVRQDVERSAPDLISTFETYAGEAEFGRRFIEDDIDRLEPGSRILEVGAGALLLSCQLVREGFDVTALEPVGQGFSHFNRLQEIVRERARSENCLPQDLPSRGEDLSIQKHFDFAFSINVMEHVDDISRVIRNVLASLRSGAWYHFTCPNYLFPYEPHFNIPTLFSKKLTFTVLRSKIEGGTMPDPMGSWKSLNWINVPQVAKIASGIGARAVFNKRLLVKTLERVVSDPVFSARRSGWLSGIIAFLVKLRMHKLAGLMPASAQPIMDCTIFAPET